MRPFFAVYVVWHPAFTGGQQLADEIMNRYRRNLRRSLDGGLGLSVLFRSAPARPGETVPSAIDVSDAQATAIVVLVEPALILSDLWLAYVRRLEATVQEEKCAQLIPVYMNAHVSRETFGEQGLAYHAFEEHEKLRQLTIALSHEFCRMIRGPVESLGGTKTLGGWKPGAGKLKVFLSHSKHDRRGIHVATKLNSRLTELSLDSFLDVHDIPVGSPFELVLTREAGVRAMITVHTDSYSSREWCRREVLEAKRLQVPLVVAGCLDDVDDRSFPYLGNVPMVHASPPDDERLDAVISRLLDEILVDLIWRWKVATTHVTQSDGMVVFLPRHPEPLSLMVQLDPARGASDDAREQEAQGATLLEMSRSEEVVAVYPDPPLGAEEERLLNDLAPNVQFRSYLEWLSGAIR